MVALGDVLGRGRVVRWDRHAHRRRSQPDSSLPGPPKPASIGTWQRDEYEQALSCTARIADECVGRSPTRFVPGEERFVISDATAHGRPVRDHECANHPTHSPPRGSTTRAASRTFASSRPIVS